jgi:mRNA-degrading endonuclease toxin of MazEF toxin-antitoxin module
MIQRGDVIIVDFPYTDIRASQAGPALVVQNDVDNARRRKTIIALITGNLRVDGDPSHLLIDPTTPNGSASGLHGPSWSRAITCSRSSRAEFSAPSARYRRQSWRGSTLA